MTRADAEKIAESFVNAIRGSGNADLMWENDDGRQVPLDESMRALILRVRREAMEQCNLVLTRKADARWQEGRDYALGCHPSSSRKCPGSARQCDNEAELIHDCAAAIRALAEEDGK